VLPAFLLVGELLPLLIMYQRFFLRISEPHFFPPAACVPPCCSLISRSGYRDWFLAFFFFPRDSRPDSILSFFPFALVRESRFAPPPTHLPKQFLYPFFRVSLSRCELSTSRPLFFELHCCPQFFLRSRTGALYPFFLRELERIALCWNNTLPF